MRLSVSLPAADLDLIESYANEHGLSRSGAIRQAVGALRETLLGDQYQAAWEEWDEEEAAWDQTVADGLS
jgi:metal-responsive CopG/Arc/MetJ family transcriptional regulator